MNAIRLALASAPMLFLSAITALAQPAPGTHERPMTPEQAISAQGQKVAVAGVASLSDANGMAGTFIRLTAPDSDVPFVGYISSDNERQFPNPGELSGRVVEITGVVETRGSVPMINLTSPSQIRVLH